MNLNDVSEIVWKQCFEAKKNEKALVVFDQRTKEIADSLFKTGRKFCTVSKIETAKSRMHGSEPEKQVADAMFDSDIIVAPTFYSLTHTKAVHRSRKTGKARVITLPGIIKDMYLRAVPIDYKEMKQYAENICSKWKKKSLTIETESGTDLYIVTKGRKIELDSGLSTTPGMLNNLPAGEVELSPLEKKSEGKVIIDLTHPLKGKVKRPFEIKIENGEMVDCEDKELWKICSETKNGTNLAEFAVGTNPKAKIIGIMLEDEKRIKTSHIALGTSISLGGKVQSSMHLDCVFNKPTILADSEIIMKDGNPIQRIPRNRHFRFHSETEKN
ncbi:MAG: aminopeptidase [Candidatus Aenigmarchaeota archaeon]|nr:aminopeptidase [Candidatus Aenigmarchaeota archaeon]